MVIDARAMERGGGGGRRLEDRNKVEREKGGEEGLRGRRIAVVAAISETEEPTFKSRSRQKNFWV